MHLTRINESFMIYLNRKTPDLHWIRCSKSNPIEKEAGLEQKQTYITTDELAARLHYDSRYIRSALKDAVFIEGIHYIRPFGRRRVLYVWEAIERDMVKASMEQKPVIPLANGGHFNG